MWHVSLSPRTYFATEPFRLSSERLFLKKFMSTFEHRSYLFVARPPRSSVMLRGGTVRRDDLFQAVRFEILTSSACAQAYQPRKRSQPFGCRFPCLRECPEWIQTAKTIVRGARAQC